MRVHDQILAALLLAATLWLSGSASPAQNEFSDQQGQPASAPHLTQPPDDSMPLAAEKAPGWADFRTSQTGRGSQNSDSTTAAPRSIPADGQPLPQFKSRFHPELDDAASFVIKDDPAHPGQLIYESRPKQAPPPLPGLTAEQDRALFADVDGVKKKLAPGDLSDEISKNLPRKPGDGPLWTKQKLEDMRYYQDNQQYQGSGDPYGFAP